MILPFNTPLSKVRSLRIIQRGVNRLYFAWVEGDRNPKDEVLSQEIVVKNIDKRYARPTFSLESNQMNQKEKFETIFF